MRSALRKGGRRRLVLALAGAAAMAAASAQETPPAQAGYQDHYIAEGKLAPDISYGEGGYSDTGGLARSLRVDALVTAISHHAGGANVDQDESGVIVESQWDTAATAPGR